MTRPAKFVVAILVAVTFASCGREGRPTGPSGQTSFLTGTWRGTVTIQVGETLVTISLSQHHQGDDPEDAPFYWSETSVEVDGQVNMTPYAEWLKWRDLQPEAAAVDTLLDYIQIVAL